MTKEQFDNLIKNLADAHVTGLNVTGSSPFNAFIAGASAAYDLLSGEIESLYKIIDDNWITHQQVIAANKLKADLKIAVDALKKYAAYENRDSVSNKLIAKLEQK